MTFEDMVKLLYFMTFILKLHILATRCQTSGFFSIFGHISAIFFRTSVLKWKNWIKLKSFTLSSKVMCNFFVYFFLSNSVRKSYKMAETCRKMVKIQIFKPLVIIVVGQRPTTDLFHVLAYVHGHCLVMGSTGVGQRPTSEPPAGARIFWHVAQKNSSNVI